MGLLMLRILVNTLVGLKRITERKNNDSDSHIMSLSLSGCHDTVLLLLKHRNFVCSFQKYSCNLSCPPDSYMSALLFLESPVIILLLLYCET